MLEGGVGLFPKLHRLNWLIIHEHRAHVTHQMPGLWYTTGTRTISGIGGQDFGKVSIHQAARRHPMNATHLIPPHKIVTYVTPPPTEITSH